MLQLAAVLAVIGTATAAPWHCFVSAAAIKWFGCMRHSFCLSVLEPLVSVAVWWLCADRAVSCCCPCVACTFLQARKTANYWKAVDLQLTAAGEVNAATPYRSMVYSTVGVAGPSAAWCTALRALQDCQPGARCLQAKVHACRANLVAPVGQQYRHKQQSMVPK